MNTIKETTQKRFIAWLCALVMAISVIGSLPLQTALAVDAPPNLLGTNSAYYYPDNVINDNMAVSKSPLKRDEKGYYIDWLVSLNVNGKLYEGANQTNHIIVLPNVVKQPERISYVYNWPGGSINKYPNDGREYYATPEEFGAYGSGGWYHTVGSAGFNNDFDKYVAGADAGRNTAALNNIKANASGLMSIVTGLGNARYAEYHVSFRT
ncbi:MAG: hypothetical protein SPL05_05870 [Eubacteriales bacterium]|nr:hypothetical protein [Eubacteriales bacterium]